MPALALADAKRSRDPTQTLGLRKAFRAAAKLRLRQLRAQMRVALIDHNVLGFGSGEPSYAPAHTRLAAFAGWLDSTGRQMLFGGAWMRPYIARAWNAGALKAMHETNSPQWHDHSEAIVELANIEVEGIIAVTVQQVSREAAHVIARGMRRYYALRALFRVFDKIAVPRMVATADVMVVKAYNAAKLDVYQLAGVQRIGIDAEVLPHQHYGDALTLDRPKTLPEELLEVAAEFTGRAGLQREFEETEVGVLTAGDDLVCQECDDFAAGSPYEIDEVLDVLPLHPRCRCAVFPWYDRRYKGEDTTDFYDPNEPRVPAGSGETSGQWTAGGGGEAVEVAAPSKRARKVETVQQPTNEQIWHAEKGVVASRNITAKTIKSIGYARPDVAAMREDPKKFDHNTSLFRNTHAYPNFRPDELKGTPNERVAKIVEHLKANLKYVYDNASEGIKKSGMMWYDRARELAVADAAKFGIDERSAAGVIATLSPQKDWNMNIYLAHRVMEINYTQKNHVWDEKMQDTAYGVKKIWKAKDLELINKIKGKTLGELSKPAEKAAWIRTFDEAHSDRTYHNFDTGKIEMTAKGVPAKAAWQSIPAIASAVECLDSKGNLKIISDALGEKHKVRSFYNNIIAPRAPNGDVTVDTHAVGAALMRALSGKDSAVMHALGTAPQRPPGERGKDWKPPPGWKATSKSAKTGLSGTYAIYADAYREVAKEVGILPQQLQAIVWQAKRELFSGGSLKKAAIEREWIKYHDNKQNLQATQQNVLKIARTVKGEEEEEEDDE